MLLSVSTAKAKQPTAEQSNSAAQPILAAPTQPKPCLKLFFKMGSFQCLIPS